MKLSPENDCLRKWRRQEEETIRKVCLQYEEKGRQDALTKFLQCLNKFLQAFWLDSQK